MYVPSELSKVDPTYECKMVGPLKTFPLRSETVVHIQNFIRLDEAVKAIAEKSGRSINEVKSDILEAKLKLPIIEGPVRGAGRRFVYQVDLDLVLSAIEYGTR